MDTNSANERIQNTILSVYRLSLTATHQISRDTHKIWIYQYIYTYTTGISLSISPHKHHTARSRTRLIYACVCKCLKTVWFRSRVHAVRTVSEHTAAAVPLLQNHTLHIHTHIYLYNTHTHSQRLLAVPASLHLCHSARYCDLNVHILYMLVTWVGVSLLVSIVLRFCDCCCAICGRRRRRRRFQLQRA